MSDTYGTTGTTGTTHDGTRELGAVGIEPSHGSADTTTSGSDASSHPGGTKDVAKDEARATAAQAKDGATHVMEVGKDEAKNVAHETGQ